MSGNVTKLKQTLNLMRFCLGAERPTIGPLRVQWDITQRCNSRCRHCHRWEANQSDASQLTRAEGEMLISELAATGTLNLSFAGNEPLLREDLFDLVALANEQGLVTNLNSNAWLIDETVASSLCRTGLDMIYLSLDGATSETHDSTRGVAGSYDRVWRAVALLREARGKSRRPRIMINTVVNRENCRQIIEIARLCQGQRVDGLLVQPLHSVETQFEAVDDLLPSDDEVAAIRQQLAALMRDFPHITPLMPDYYNQFDTFYRSPGALYRYRCLAAYATADIRPNGDVTPCPAWNEKLGNVREDGSFLAAWNSARADEIRKKIKGGRHPICWFACVAPMNLLVHDLRSGRLGRVLRPRLLAHILRKVGKRDG